MDALRSQLLPFVHKLPAPVHNAGVSLLGSDCYSKLVLHLDIIPTTPLSSADLTCHRLALSKGLGLGIILGSSIVKVPQILKILNSQSAEGVSFLSYVLETASFLIGLSYSARNGWPFSTYGETALIAVQDVVIALLVLQFTGGGKNGKSNGNSGVLSALFVGSVAVVLYALMNESIVDMNLLKYFQAGAGLLAVGSKVPQILAVWQQGGTGQLSAFAVFNYLFGSLARVYTTIQEVDDNLILYGFIAGLFLNAILAGQMIYYWNSPASNTPKKLMGKSKAKSSEPMSMGSTTGATPKPKGPSTRRRG